MEISNKARVAFRLLSRNLKRLKYFRRNFYLTKDLYASSLKSSYLGIPLVKFPSDLVVLTSILWKVKPQLIIEIGTHEGGSALWMCHQMEKIRDDFEIHTIDVVDKVNDSRVLQEGRIKRFLDGYEGYPLTDSALGKTTLVIDDGSHFYEDVVNAFHVFSPLVTVGSYYIVEDGITEYLGSSDELKLEGGPYRAIKQILRETNDFLEDSSVLDPWTKNPTANPLGYLKQIPRS